jgi:membrane peptidoglycan carboxypeptidase
VNIAEWGPGVFGLEEASQYWFKKKASQLNAYEALRLSSILSSPISMNPYHFDDMQEAKFALCYHYLHQNRGIMMEDLKLLMK